MMGYMRHHAIIVTSWDVERLELARDRAADIGLKPTRITPEAVNGYQSFMVPPDGSKEGWEESDVGDDARAALVSYLRAQECEDGSSYLSWVEVMFGDDDGGCEVVHHGDDDA
jgi:hypothetical protein